MIFARISVKPQGGLRTNVAKHEFVGGTDVVLVLRVTTAYVATYLRDRA